MWFKLTLLYSESNFYLNINILNVIIIFLYKLFISILLHILGNTIYKKRRLICMYLLCRKISLLIKINVNSTDKLMIVLIDLRIKQIQNK